MGRVRGRVRARVRDRARVRARARASVHRAAACEAVRRRALGAGGKMSAA